MRRIVMLMCWLAVAVPAIASTGFKSQEDLSQWLTYYYENPEPARIPDAMKYMSESGIFDNEGAAPPIIGFLSGVFRSNPGQANSWVNALSSLNEKHLGIVILGLWYADLPESQSRVHALLEKHPKLKSSFGFLYKGEPITVERISLEQGPWVLDALWGNFMATGASAPVERIIVALPWFSAKGDVNRLLIGGAARWSLTSNAIQHKRVLEICEGAAKAESGEIAVALEEIVENAKKENQQGMLRDKGVQRP